MHPKKKSLNISVWMSGVSLIFIIIGIVLITLRTTLYDTTIRNLLILHDSGPVFDIWRKSSFPINFDVYFFNWTNPHEFNNHSTKPRFNQMGPYRFSQVNEKVNITFHNNDTVTYNQTKTWFFKPEESRGKLDDPITSINPVAVSGAYATRFLGSFMKGGLSISLRGLASGIDLTKSVDEFMFSGYNEPLITIAQTLPIPVKLPPMDKFAWFYERNGSSTFDGRFNMGIGKTKAFGKIYTYNDDYYTPYNEGECAKVDGSAGEFYPENLEKTNLKFFNPESCRTIVADYEKEVPVHGILGYKYILGDNFFDNGTKVPGNECYCGGECVPYGLVNVSSCRYGSPGFVSQPHFYNADSSYLDAVEGLHPDRKKHEFHMIMEPRTGLPLQIAARLQLNLMVQPYEGISLFEDVPKLFFPVLWFEQVVTIPDDLAFKIKFLTNLPVILTAIAILSINLGLLILFCTTYKYCFAKLCHRNHKIQKELVPLHQDTKVIVVR